MASSTQSENVIQPPLDGILILNITTVEEPYTVLSEMFVAFFKYLNSKNI